MPSYMHQIVTWQCALQTLGRMVMVPAIATASWGLPAMVQPQSNALAAQQASLCRLTQINTTRFRSDSLGSETLGSIPAGTPILLMRSPDSRRSPLVEVRNPPQYAGFVPIDALGSCGTDPVPPPTQARPVSVCRRVIAKAAPSGVPIRLRSQPVIPTGDSLANFVGTVTEGAFVYVMTTDGRSAKAFNDGTFTWIQIDLKQTRTLNNAPVQFTISSATDPAEVWMFNSDINKPGLSNLSQCPAR
jgi:hypothetical protein